MKISSMSRRALFEASTGVMAASIGIPNIATADTGEGLTSNNDHTIRK